MGIEDRKMRERRQREQLILAAAKKVVAANGFRKTTMGLIAREAEISAGTIYLYFKNKEELFISLALHPLQHIELSIQDIWRTHKEADFDYKIDALHRVLIEAYKFDPLIFANTFHLLSVERLDRLTSPVFSQVKQLLQKIHSHLLILFKNDKVKTKSTDQIKRIEDLFFILLLGNAIWSSISNQIFGYGATGDCLESYNAAFHLFLRASKTALSCLSTDQLN